jgi:CysZ protein
MDDFTTGFFYPFRSLKIFFADKRLVRKAIVPVIINMIIYGTIFILTYRWIFLKTGEIANTGGDASWWQYLLYVLILIFAFVVLTIICYFAYQIFGSIVSASYNEKISQLTEEKITGEKLVTDYGFIKDFYLSTKSEIFKLLFYFSVMFIIFIIGFLPFIGVIFSTVFGFLFTVFFNAFDFFDYPMARKLFTLNRKINITLRGRMFTFGFGLISFILMVTPFLNILMKPILVASGTSLYFEKIERKIPKVR